MRNFDVVFCVSWKSHVLTFFHLEWTTRKMSNDNLSRLKCFGSRKCFLNSVWNVAAMMISRCSTGVVIWRHVTWSTLVQIMVGFLTVPNRYKSQCWLINNNNFNTSPLVPHICVSELGEHCACSAPSRYLNQCWLIVKWTLSNTLQWNSNQRVKLFIHVNATKHVVCQMVVILSRGRCQLWNIFIFHF